MSSGVFWTGSSCFRLPHPEGQRRPTLSEDLKAALASGARVRVIVQAEEDALAALRFRLGRGLRRQLAGALSLDVSGGIDWTIANARRYGVRLINLALGHPSPSRRPPTRSAAPSPAPSAPGSSWFVSAGNHGRTAEGAPVLGGITSPGNSPFAITG